MAWLVLDSLGRPLLRAHKLASWLNGRGGFLSDQLGYVREASLRLQVLSPSALSVSG